MARGPRDGAAPAEEGLWSVLTVKQFGERPGMLIADENANLFILRFDPRGHLDLATGAELVSSRLVYALGYNVMDTHLVYFERERLQIASGGDNVTSFGEARDLLPEDIDRFLQDTARDPRRGYRAVAVRIPRADILGPFQLYATRADDPNDVVPHEHRRELRGLFVVSSWIAHDTFRSIKTMDVLDERDGVPAIRHYLVDFLATLGSAGSRPKFAEVHEPAAKDRGVSSTMPHKRNPVLSQQIVVAARLTRAQTSSMLEAMVQDHERGSATWQMEWTLIPDAAALTLGGLERTLELVAGLEIHPERMRENLGLTRQLIYAEAVMMALAPQLGRQKAHDLVESAVAEARAGKSFFDALRQSPVISNVLSAANLHLIFNGETHIEAADRVVKDVLTALTEDQEKRRWNK